MSVKGKRRGLMVVLSAPSGAGKSSLAQALLDCDSNIVLSVSATTRNKRPGEKEGVDYYFMNEPTFEVQIEKEWFLEHARVFGRYYGTPKHPVMTALEQSKDVLFDIDGQGGAQLCQKARDDVVSIFILPPSIKELAKRLYNRGQDSVEEIDFRMQQAQGEVAYYRQYDWVIINDNFNVSLKAIQTILASERMRRQRLVDLDCWVDDVFFTDTH